MYIFIYKKYKQKQAGGQIIIKLKCINNEVIKNAAVHSSNFAFPVVVGVVVAAPAALTSDFCFRCGRRFCNCYAGKEHPLYILTQILKQSPLQLRCIHPRCVLNHSTAAPTDSATERLTLKARSPVVRLHCMSSATMWALSLLFVCISFVVACIYNNHAATCTGWHNHMFFALLLAQQHSFVFVFVFFLFLYVFFFCFCFIFNSATFYLLAARRQHAW